MRTEANRLTPRLVLASALLFVSFVPRESVAQSGRTPAGVDPSKPTQKNKNAPQQPPALKRTTTRQETRRFAYGGRVRVYGAPQGSVTIEAWPKSEVEVSADIEVQADTEEDLARLASVTNFVLDDDLNLLTLATVGTHDRQYMKRAARDFPKRLLGLPWKIDYRIRVPAQLDLEIYGGRGALEIKGTDGALSLNAGQSEASLTLAGGDVVSTVAAGSIRLRIPTRSWRGRGASIRLGSGDLIVELPAGFDGDLDATVLRTGRVENNHPALLPRPGVASGARQLRARAGSGGATLTLEVTDGTLRITQLSSDKKEQ